jgi:hypothetical protein
MKKANMPRTIEQVFELGTGAHQIFKSFDQRYRVELVVPEFLDNPLLVSGYNLSTGKVHEKIYMKRRYSIPKADQNLIACL